MTRTPSRHDASSRLHEVTEAVEAERRRLARLLEETVIGQLNLLLAQANAYELTLGSPDARMAVAVLASLARQAQQQALDLEGRLHPATLDALGLEPALEALAGQELRLRGLRVILITPRLRERLAAQIELALFRLVQDAVERATHEGRASEITVRLEKQDDTLTLTLEDDGLPPPQDTLRAACGAIEALGAQVTLRRGARGGLWLHAAFDMTQPERLSEREMDVVRLVAEGLTNRQIAARLGIGPRTVKYHLDNIFSKLGVGSRTEAAVIALRSGWVADQRPPGAR
jgi:DNA-binding CsgD family transcriptional regulator/signal transduction histidine kinase